MSQVSESWTKIKTMIADREIEPCPRMNTDACTHSEFSDFPDPETLPMCFDVSVLLRCDRCIFRVLEKIERHTCNIAEVEGRDEMR